MITTDGPLCHKCGSLMVRRAACHKCLNCGAESPEPPPSPAPWTPPPPSTDPLEQRLDAASERVQHARTQLALTEHDVQRAGGDRTTNTARQNARRRLRAAERAFARARLKWEVKRRGE